MILWRKGFRACLCRTRGNMVLLNWDQKVKKLLNSTHLREPFHILTIAILSLLLPLSFLLLSRFSYVYYLLSFESYPSSELSSFLLSFFLYINPGVLYLIVSIVSVATLTHGLTGKLSFLTELPGPVSRPRLYTGWIFVFTLQVSVCLGIEGTIAAGVDGRSLDIEEESLLSRGVFFLGLYEMMIHWSRVVVKPVVDDTILGFVREERWAETVAMAVSFAALWWWKLREQVGLLVVLPELKREFLMGIGAADFTAWWLYYLAVTIGMVKIMKGFMRLGMLLLCRRARGKSPDSNMDEQMV